MLTILARKRSCRVSIFLAAYSQSEKLLHGHYCAVNVPTLSQISELRGRRQRIISASLATHLQCASKVDARYAFASRKNEYLPACRMSVLEMYCDKVWISTARQDSGRFLTATTEIFRNHLRACSIDNIMADILNAARAMPFFMPTHISYIEAEPLRKYFFLLVNKPNFEGFRQHGSAI
jgi:hypothetical protein